MATSRNTGYSTADTDSGVVLEELVGLSRYDVVLAGIPLAFALALLTYVVAPVSFQLAITVGATTSMLLLLDAVYLNPPVGSGSDRSRY